MAYDQDKGIVLTSGRPGALVEPAVFDRMRREVIPATPLLGHIAVHHSVIDARDAAIMAERRAASQEDHQADAAAQSVV